MRAGAGAVERVLLVRPRSRWFRHLLLAVSLVVMVLSIVGMHQLSLGNDVSTGPPSSVAQAEPAHHALSVIGTMPAAMGAQPRDHTAGGMSDAGMGGACPDCADHQMALGSCLLALTLLVLSWLLAPPRLTHVAPFLLPRPAATVVRSTVDRLVPALSLAELSLRRT